MKTLPKCQSPKFFWLRPWAATHTHTRARAQAQTHIRTHTHMYSLYIGLVKFDSC